MCNIVYIQQQTANFASQQQVSKSEETSNQHSRQRVVVVMHTISQTAVVEVCVSFTVRLS